MEIISKSAFKHLLMDLAFAKDFESRKSLVIDFAKNNNYPEMLARANDGDFDSALSSEDFQRDIFEDLI